jgi:signal transduction histidine kinase
MAQVTSLDRFSELIDAAAGVVGETDLERVLRRLVTEARTATGARYAALGVLGEHGVLSEFLFEGISDEEAARIGNLPTGKGVLGTVIRENRTIRLDDIGSHSDTSGFPSNHPPMTTFLGVPVSVGDTAFGNLYLTEKAGGFSDDDVILVEALSKIAGAAVRTSRLQDRLRRVAVIEDRQRIARDLHDSVIQDLFAVGLGLQGVSQIVEDTRAAATIIEAVDRLDEAVETLRTYIFDLRQIEDAHPSLEDRLSDLVTRMSSAYPATVTLKVRVSGEGDGTLDDDIVKMVTEGLSNALRHASARHVHVEVMSTADGWALVVQDDGVGFDQGVDHGGMGLGNLQARVERHGGRVSVDTRPGAGTILTMTMPLP